MVELVYTHDLKSCPSRDAGSIPALGTRINENACTACIFINSKCKERKQTALLSSGIERRSISLCDDESGSQALMSETN